MGYRGGPDCRKRVQNIPGPVGEACDLPHHIPGLRLDCKAAVPTNRMRHSWLIFDGPLRHALHPIKFRRSNALGDILTHHPVEYRTDLEWPGDRIVPSPLVNDRIRNAAIIRPDWRQCRSSRSGTGRMIPWALTGCLETRIRVSLITSQNNENARGPVNAWVRFDAREGHPVEE
jgi:hypothetical protein